MSSQAEQATAGIDVTREAGIVLVRDGQDSWLCLADRYDSVIADMRDEEGTTPAEAYGLLCERVVGRRAGHRQRGRVRLNVSHRH